MSASVFHRAVIRNGDHLSGKAARAVAERYERNAMGHRGEKDDVRNLGELHGAGGDGFDGKIAAGDRLAIDGEALVFEESLSHRQ